MRRRLALSAPRTARRGAAREGEEVEGATPSFLPLVRHRGGVSGPPFGPPFTPLLRGGRSLHTDPCGKATKPMRKPSTKILVDSDAAVGTGHVAPGPVFRTERQSRAGSRRVPQSQPTCSHPHLALRRTRRRRFSRWLPRLVRL